MNQVNIIGRLVHEVEVKYISNGTAVAHGAIAVDREMSKEKRKEAEKEGKPTADFPRIVVFGRSAEILRDYTGKGSLIGITGSIQTGKYKKDNGDTVYTTDILVRNIKLLSQKSDQKQTSNAGEFGDFSELEGGDDIPF